MHKKVFSALFPLLAIAAGISIYWLLSLSGERVPSQPPPPQTEPSKEVTEAPSPASAKEFPEAGAETAPASQAAPPLREPARESLAGKYEKQILGRLTLKGGQIPPGTLVLAELPGELAGRKVYSSEASPEGSFAIGMPDFPTQATLRAESEFLYGAPVTARRGDDGSFPEVTIPLQAGGKIEGKVLLPGGGPAKGARVLLARALDPFLMQGLQGGGLPPKPREGSTADDGSFALRGVPPGPDGTLRADLKGHGPGLAKKLLVKPMEVVRIDLQLLPEAVLAGKVLSPEGSPIEGAKVQAIPWQGMGGFLELGAFQNSLDDLLKTESSADGSFRLGSLGPGTYRVAGQKQGRDGSLGESVRLEAGMRKEDLRLTLGKGSAISGRVLDWQGSPVAGAKVEAKIDLFSGETMNISIGEDQREAGTSGADGSFRLEGLGKSLYEVSASLEGMGQGKKSKVRGGTKDVEIRLAPAGGIAGRVIAAAGGTPIPKFQIELVRVEQQGFVQVPVRKQWFEDRKEGAFEIAGLAPGKLRAVVTAEGFAALKKPVEIREGETRQDLEFALQLAATVRGKVQAAGSGLPIEGAEVSQATEGAFAWVQDRMDKNTAKAWTDAEGGFEISGLGSGKISLRATHADFAVGTQGPIELGPGETVEGIQFLLSGGGGIDGFFYNDEGTPVGSAMVMATGMQSGSFKMVNSDEKGFFRIERGLAPGQYQVVGMGSFGEAEEEEEISAQLLQGMKTAFAAVEEGKVTRIVLGEKKEGGCRLRGKVLSAGAAASNVFISIVPKGKVDPQAPEVKFTATDKEGFFTLENVPAGKNTFNIQRGTYGNSSVQVEVAIPDRTEHFVELKIPGGSIAGRIVDGRTGEPISGLGVTLVPEKEFLSGSWGGGGFAQIQTDSEGRYRIGDLNPGAYTVTAAGTVLLGGENQGYGRATRRVALDAERSLEGIDFALRPGGRIEGQVTAAGAPVAGASIFFQDAAGHTINPLSEVVTDEEGSFQFDGLGEGTYTVFAKAAGYAPGRISGVSVREASTSSAQIFLTAGVEVVVRILSAVDGKALEGAAVQAFDEKGNPVTPLTGWDDVIKVWTAGVQPGEYAVGTIAPGRYRVVVTLPAYQTLEKTVEVGGQAKQVFDLKLSPQ